MTIDHRSDPSVAIITLQRPDRPDDEVLIETLPTNERRGWRQPDTASLTGLARHMRAFADALDGGPPLTMEEWRLVLAARLDIPKGYHGARVFHHASNPMDRGETVFSHGFQPHGSPTLPADLGMTSTMPSAMAVDLHGGRMTPLLRSADASITTALGADPVATLRALARFDAVLSRTARPAPPREGPRR